MKISLKWLKDYLDTTLSPAELAHRLTMAGNGVESFKTIGTTWDNIVTAQIEVVNPHPNADRLTLVTVNLGDKQETVVCGAPNVKAGEKVVFAHLGAKLFDPHSGQPVVLKQAKIRGVVSGGMVCSEKELGLSENHEGILVLPRDAPVGVALSSYIGDTIFDLEVTPNRPDCLSVIGIAREIAAMTGQTVRLAEPFYPEGGPSIAPQIGVDIVAPELCSRYCASLITGVRVTESPRWLQERLMACGQRPINNIVDITNYVMLEYGQPLHAFDYTMIRGQKIIVRRAASGEKIISLDGTERTLSPDNLVIADVERAVAVAGVMGGANSEVTENTTSILLEAANFNAVNIHYTARTLKLSSEASMRFERGIRAEIAEPALRRATQLIVALGGGTAAHGIIDKYPGKKELSLISVPISLFGKVLGIQFEFEKITQVLDLLGFSCQANELENEITVGIPYWRSDIRLPVDLIEEVARIIGYDKIPMTLLAAEIPPQNSEPLVALKRRVRQSLVGFGYQELVTFSLVSAASLQKLMPEPHPLEPAPLRLVNPMTADQEYLRPTLRTNLLAALVANRRYEEGGIRLFELSRIYLPRPKDLPDERETICALLSGLRDEKSLHAGSATVDFYDAKGGVEALLENLGAVAIFSFSQDESLHTQKQAGIYIEDVMVGIVGEVHPKVLQNFEMNEPVYLFELNLPALLTGIKSKLYQPLPRFPPVVRDIALVVDVDVPHRRIEEIIRGFSLISQVAVFDFYSGKQVPAGKKSLAYRLTFQSPEHTLNDEEVNGVMQAILKRLGVEVKAVLRT